MPKKDKNIITFSGKIAFTLSTGAANTLTTYTPPQLGALTGGLALSPLNSYELYRFTRFRCILTPTGLGVAAGLLIGDPSSPLASSSPAVLSLPHSCLMGPAAAVPIMFNVTKKYLVADNQNKWWKWTASSNYNPNDENQFNFYLFLPSAGSVTIQIQFTVQASGITGTTQSLPMVRVHVNETTRNQKCILGSLRAREYSESDARRLCGCWSCNKGEE